MNSTTTYCGKNQNKCPTRVFLWWISLEFSESQQNTNWWSHPGVLPCGIMYLGTDTFPDVVIETTIILNTSRWVSISTGCTEQNILFYYYFLWECIYCQILVILSNSPTLRACSHWALSDSVRVSDASLTIDILPIFCIANTNAITKSSVWKALSHDSVNSGKVSWGKLQWKQWQI